METKFKQYINKTADAMFPYIFHTYIETNREGDSTEHYFQTQFISSSGEKVRIRKSYTLKENNSDIVAMFYAYVFELYLEKIPTDDRPITNSYEEVVPQIDIKLQDIVNKPKKDV